MQYSNIKKDIVNNSKQMTFNEAVGIIKEIEQAIKIVDEYWINLDKKCQQLGLDKGNKIK